MLRIPYKAVKKEVENKHIDNVFLSSIYEDYEDIVTNIIKSLS